jgi:hypothetical protein
VPRETSTPRARWRPAVVPILVATIFVLVAFGVAQPLLLAEIHRGQRGTLTSADVISVLVTVVALLSASAGAAVFLVVRDRLNGIADTREAGLDERIYGAKLIERRNAAFSAWLDLEPEMVSPAPRGSVDEAVRNKTIEAACSIALGRKELTDRDNESKVTKLNADMDYAFFLACRALYVDDPEDRPRTNALALSLVPQPFDLSGIDLGQQSGLKESRAWIYMCCSERGGELWKQGLESAKNELRRSDVSAWAQRTAKARYEVAFGPEIFS